MFHFFSVKHLKSLKKTVHTNLSNSFAIKKVNEKKSLRRYNLLKDFFFKYMLNRVLCMKIT